MEVSLDTVRFHIDDETINDMTLEEYEAIEAAQDGMVKVRQLRPVLARFMVDEDGKPLEHDAAMALLGKQRMGDLEEIAAAFAAAFEDSTVPKANGSK